MPQLPEGTNFGYFVHINVVLGAALRLGLHGQARRSRGCACDQQWPDGNGWSWCCGRYLSRAHGKCSALPCGTATAARLRRCRRSFVIGTGILLSYRCAVGGDTFGGRWCPGRPCNRKRLAVAGAENIHKQQVVIPWLISFFFGTLRHLPFA